MTKLRLFLAIPYASEFNWIRDSIATACREHQVELRSVEEVVQPGGEIISAIHAEIEEADLGAAVISGMNPNVLYELGRLHQASKPTIILSDSHEPVPFDIRTFSRIEYAPDPAYRSDLEFVFAKSLSKLLYVFSEEGRTSMASGTYEPEALSVQGESREVSSLMVDFEGKRREAEQMMGKSDCETDEIKSYDTESFKGWHQWISCPGGDSLLIVIDLNGEIKKVKKI
jgi:hypothetical protein